MTKYQFTDFQERWLQALEGRVYKQGKSFLRVKTEHGKDKFCCLGVACDLYDPEGWKHTDDSYYYQVDDNYSRINLPIGLNKKLGFLKGDGSGRFMVDNITDRTGTEHLNLGARIGGSSEQCLTNLNDEDWTFKDIATLIRKNPRAFFKEVF